MRDKHSTRIQLRRTCVGTNPTKRHQPLAHRLRQVRSRALVDSDPRAPGTPTASVSGCPELTNLLATARRHAELHTWNTAIELYERALVQSHGHPDAHIGLADLYRVRGDHARAEQHYRAALNIDPHRTDAYLHLGDACREQEDLEGARDAYRLALDRDTDLRRRARARAALAALAEEPHSLCKRCGRFTCLPDFRAAGSGRRRLCPQCFTDTQGRRSLASLLTYGAVIGLQLCGLAILHPDQRAVLMLAVNMLIFALVAYALLLPHELGHAIVGRLLGARIFAIRLGVGPRVWERRVRNVSVSVHQYPWAGACILGFPRINGICWRTMATVLAGVATAAALGAHLLPTYDASRLSRGLAPTEVLVLAAALQTVSNLFPYRFRAGGVAAQTDGATFLNLLLGRTTASELHHRYYLLAAQDALAHQDPDAAADLTNQGLAHYPDDTLLRNVSAVAMLHQGAPDRAIAAFEELLADFNAASGGAEATGPGALQRLVLEATLRNNVAAARVALDGGASAPATVRHHSRRAYEILPWEPTIESTWGAVLLHQGRPQQGLTYLAAALDHEDNPGNRAAILAYMALAHQRLGRPGDADACLALAHDLDADHLDMIG